MMSRAPTVIRAVRIALVASLALSLLAPMAALGAKGSQQRIEVDSTPLIERVSPGASLAFSASFTNNGPGTITHLLFTGTAPGAIFERATAPCAGAGSEVVCDLGKFKAGTSVELAFVFTAPSSGAVAFSGQFAGDARKGNPNAASSDIWPVASTSITVDPSSGFFGSWQAAHEGLRTFDPIASDGQQSTVTAHPVATDYAVTLGHAGGLIDCAPGDLGDGFGQVLELSVADGGTAVDLKIVYAPDAVDKKAKHVRLVHELDNGTCVLVPRCDGEFDGNCFVAFYLGDYYEKQLVIKAQLPQNGRVKGY